MKVYRLSTKFMDPIEINEVLASVRETFEYDYDYDSFIIDCYTVNDEPYVYARLNVIDGYYIDDNKIYNEYGDYLEKETREYSEVERAVGIILNTFGFRKRKD